MNNTSILECNKISHYYNGSKKPTLDSVSLTLNKTELLDLNGPSGTGKSTLLSIIGGLLPPTAGEVMLFGESIYSLSRNKLALLHKRNIGFLFQNYFLLPDLTIKENILLKGTLAGMTQHALEDACKKWLEVLKLTHRSNAYPNTLSGGEQQRAGLIRAIIHSPALLLCDEPTGNLDNENRDLIIKMLLDLKERSEMGIIVVSHDPIFSDISDKTIHLT